MGNGNGNGIKPIPERDEKGRFVPGGPGGPGRGKKDRDALNEKALIVLVEDLARDIAATSKDEKIKLKAGTVLLKVEGFKKPEDSPPVLSTYQQKLIKFTLHVIPRLALAEGVSELEMLDRMLEGCPCCAKFGSGDPDKVGGVKLGLDETTGF